MGRHSASYIAAQQGLSEGASPIGRASANVGRVGLLAVALGIGIAVASGTAIASADPPSSNADTSSISPGPSVQQSAGDADGDTTAEADDNSAVEAEKADDNSGDDADADEANAVVEEVLTDAEIDDDPGSVPSLSLTGSQDTAVRERGGSHPAVDTDLMDPDGESAYTVQAFRTAAVSDDSQPPAVDVAVPSPTDQTATDYGDIGKWMLQWNGKIADYGGLPYDGKTVLEPVNVIIVDPTSRSSLEASWKLSVAMRRAGFPPRLIHSTGFRGLIDDHRYRQKPGGLLAGYSDRFFLLPNNHGRIFGPDPVETSTGYVWSGAFSKEELAVVNFFPRHVYVSSNTARDALAAQLVASGRATLGGMVSLGNSYNTDTTTTGDHDGYAAVVILNPNGVIGASTNAALPGAATSSRSCSAHASSAISPRLLQTVSCGAVSVAAGRDLGSGSG